MFLRSVRADRRERARNLPGDGLVAGPAVAATHAVTIRRSRHAVWPWLVQMGAGRAGWYSYDFIDNGGHRSADRILPELQDIAVGSLLPALPGATDGFFVLQSGNRPYGLAPWLLRLVGPWGHFVMQRKQLLGIARRAERSEAPA